MYESDNVYFQKEKRRGGNVMYTIPIIMTIIGTVFLGFNIYLFLSEYKEAATHQSKKHLSINYMALICSLIVLSLGVAYFFIINSQL